MKYALLAACLCFFIYSKAQTISPKLEVYAAPGLFFEQLSKDSLIPAARRNIRRLGDVTSYAIQAAVPLKNQRWLLKAGVGLSTRHYSINKYGIDDFITSLFLFDAQPHRDTFNISYVRFTNNYFQIPFSIAYSLNKPNQSFQLYAGLNFRNDFLIKNKANVKFDSSYKIPTAADINAAQKMYTANATKFVLTIEPYLETYFKIYNRSGAFIQLRPFSLQASSLDKKLTTSTSELLSFTFGVSYSFK